MGINKGVKLYSSWHVNEWRWQKMFDSIADVALFWNRGFCLSMIMFKRSLTSIVTCTFYKLAFWQNPEAKDKYLLINRISIDSFAYERRVQKWPKLPCGRREDAIASLLFNREGLGTSEVQDGCPQRRSCQHSWIFTSGETLRNSAFPKLLLLKCLLSH